MRRIINFFKTALGMVVIFVVVAFFIVLIAGKVTAAQRKAEKTKVTTTAKVIPVAATDQQKAVQVFDRNTAPMPILPPARPVQQKVVPRATPVPTPKPIPKRPEAMKIFAGVTARLVTEPFPADDRTNVNYRPPVRKFGQRYAPYGRLAKCELVNTLDSSKQETPIIGLVTSDVFWNGELIIPVGSEVHGTVSSDKQGRDRISSTSRWVVVLPANNDLPHGAEMVVRGTALDMSDVRGDQDSWGITDGSFGIQGYTIKTAQAEEVKLFVSAFLSQSAQALQSRQSTVFGSQLETTPQNAALNGTSAVINKYAEDIAAQIKEFGAYTRVPAGKQFYLYFEQTLDSADARVGDSSARVRQRDGDSEASEDDYRRRLRGAQLYNSAGINQVDGAPSPFFSTPAPVETTNPYVPGSIPSRAQMPNGQTFRPSSSFR